LKLRNKDLDLQAFHPLGTCQMGADPRNSVVDGMGRVYGVDNVFIADGSIFPTSLGVNPMVTIMAAATKIAGHISREHL
jgi:choline dehydrogenase-like flavoprotein